MAMEDLPAHLFSIHHSDRGCQYCCHEYVNQLRQRGLSISMTEQNLYYENAKAEGVIGILKQEYEMDAIYQTKQQAIQNFRQAVMLSNNCPPDLSLNT